MKLVVLMNEGSRFGLTILNELEARDIRVAAVVSIQQPLRYDLQLFRFVRRRVGFVQAVYFGVRRMLYALVHTVKDRWFRPDFVTDPGRLADQVLRTHGTNTPETLGILEKLQPDVIVIGQTGILREKLLKIPRIGALNGHPGILPDYRGIDSFQWAILNDEPEKVGCTVHWIDTGVDTGPVLRSNRFPVANTNEGLITLEDRLFDFTSIQLAEVVQAIDCDDPPRGTAQRPQQGKQYHKMSLRQERIVRRKLKSLS